MRDLSVWPGVCWVLVSIRHTHMMGNLSLRYVPGPVREVPQSGETGRRPRRGPESSARSDPAVSVRARRGEAHA